MALHHGQRHTSQVGSVFRQDKTIDDITFVIFVNDSNGRHGGTLFFNWNHSKVAAFNRCV